MSVVTKQSGFLLPTVYAGVKQSWHTCEEQPSIWNPLFKHLLNVLGCFFVCGYFMSLCSDEKKHKSNKTNDSGGGGQRLVLLSSELEGFIFPLYSLLSCTDRQDRFPSPISSPSRGTNMPWIKLSGWRSSTSLWPLGENRSIRPCDSHLPPHCFSPLWSTGRASLDCL